MVKRSFECNSRKSNKRLTWASYIVLIKRITTRNST